MSQPEYVFTSAGDQREIERLQAIERECDPASRRRLGTAGLTTGWRCLEVGPGAGSVMRWMADKVGPSGRVCAVDLSTKFLPAQLPAHVEIRQADIRTVPLPAASFDLVHARYVLIHLPDFEVALSAMLAALKPGGWLVLEEPDFSSSRGIAGEAAQLASVRRINQAIQSMYETRGMDAALGLKLLSLLQVRGLHDLAMEFDAPWSPGGSEMARLMAMSAAQLRDKYLATGLVTESDVEDYGRFTEDPRSRAIYYATVAVMGRKRSE
ncbi:MAG: class I SAM-dependent methyltransferase [Nitrospira sp.]|jgi:SAM-dependent methyltransferase|nr:class I SAM-dependent methyltransferase [Nitrospira sp.]